MLGSLPVPTRSGGARLAGVLLRESPAREIARLMTSRAIIK